jgi:hypothetical protein
VPNCVTTELTVAQKNTPKLDENNLAKTEFSPQIFVFHTMRIAALSLEAGTAKINQSPLTQLCKPQPRFSKCAI